MNLNNYFFHLVNSSIDELDKVSDPNQKATVLSRLAMAVAIKLQSENMSIIDDKNETEKEASVEKKSKAEDDVKINTKEKLQKDPQNEQNEVDDFICNPVAEEIVEEWTDEMLEVFTEEIKFVSSKMDELGEETLNDLVKEFSNDVLKTFDDINPYNIKAFICFIEESEKKEKLH